MFLPWRILQTEEAGKLQSIGSHRVRHDEVTEPSRGLSLVWNIGHALSQSLLQFRSLGNNNLAVCFEDQMRLYMGKLFVYL